LFIKECQEDDRLAMIEALAQKRTAGIQVRCFALKLPVLVEDRRDII
jgi:hypothetical protein